MVTVKRIKKQENDENYKKKSVKLLLVIKKC